MLFNSLSFLVFFPVVVLLYFLVPKKLRYVWLLTASYFFYMCWNPLFILLLFASTVTTFFAGYYLARLKRKKTAGKVLLAGGIIFNLGILFVFKYFVFAWQTLQKLLLVMHISVADFEPNILLPVGISFYTFQALGYMIDIYRGEIEPEESFIKYALFVSFFPQLVAGPIERSRNLLPQLNALPQLKLWDSERIQRGALTMLYGYVLKMVIADRAAMYVNTVFDPETYSQYQGLTIAIGIMLFSVQIYCDFAGYSYIAIGAAKIMGISLSFNFLTPYFARSIKEFWDRWHITLSTWFRDYLYFPLGGSRKGKARKYLNILVIFGVSGLWHGASWHYVVWGLLHGVLRVVGEVTARLRGKIVDLLRIRKSAESFKVGQMLVTFVLVAAAWVFFRAESVHQATDILKNVVSVWNPWVLFDGSLMSLGLDAKEWNVLIAAFAFMFIVSLLQYRKVDIGAVFLRQNLLFKFLMLYLGIFIVIIYGVYGAEYNASQFIYFQF